MIAKQQIIEKINTLSAYCTANGEPGGGYADFIATLNSAITQYFSSVPSELSDSIRLLIFNIYNDIMLRNTTYEKPIGPAIPTNFPPGYNDLGSLFDGDGALSAILSMDNATFLNGFPVETSTDETTGASSTVVLINPIITTWITKLSTAHAAEFDKVEAIRSFCQSCSFGQDLIGLTEDRGKSTTSVTKEDILTDIYVTKKYKDVITSLGLDVWIPTYLS
jgi:hypothetical protein